MQMRFMIPAAVLLTALTTGCDGDGDVTGDADIATDTLPDADAPADVDVDVPEDTGDEDVPTLENCEGYVEPPAYPPGDGSDCRGDSDCDTMGFCYLPGMSVCGMCPEPMRQCETDEDCVDGICIEIPPPCDYCPGGNSSSCIAPCTTGSCGDGETCNTEMGRCEPIACGEGYDCPPNRRCTSTGDGHGCSVLDCTTDSDCDCGVCAHSGTCLPGPGSCSGPAA